ncbi:hypothetical protein ACLK1S_22915 [Escherichia coli]
MEVILSHPDHLIESTLTMDSQRNLLLIALLFVSFLIWRAWEQDKNPQPQAQRPAQTTTTAATAPTGVPASGRGN